MDDTKSMDFLNTEARYEFLVRNMFHNVPVTNGFGPQLCYANKHFPIRNRGTQCLSLNQPYPRIFKQAFRGKYFHWL